ncbi:hypothetical protein JNUCC1_00223 [Lentibacillus sp. JNUCC-1]|uniref:helix-turn-helix domain-containing protein n=1 Tax=Lentibacillus sp. JNUCC-1 TaxID=2654513 RepID=UPI0012E77DCD|nr:helix-turn-helix domain-containing protein [Lentibacillus sp. JNUCC-1]MUV36421.1 hypothetical protein [Lentibacillus sp. JNUCC-1]
MGHPHYSAEFKWKVVQEYKKEGRILAKMTRKYGVHRNSVKRWTEIVDKEGKAGLKHRPHEKAYSKKIKQAAIDDYRSGGYSLREITKKYNISSPSVLRKWLKDYNRHRDLLERLREEKVSMATKGRKTTKNERLQIVEEVLKNNRDYNLIATTFGVSYQQVYRWVQEFEKGGFDALEDRRGKPKPETALTTEEKLKRQLRDKEKENERLQARVDFLKKSRSLERGDSQQ